MKPSIVLVFQASGGEAGGKVGSRATVLLLVLGRRLHSCTATSASTASIHRSCKRSVMASHSSRQPSAPIFSIDATCDIDALLASVSVSDESHRATITAPVPHCVPPHSGPQQPNSTQAGNTIKRVAGKIRQDTIINETMRSASPTFPLLPTLLPHYDSKQPPPPPPPSTSHPDVAVAAEESREPEYAKISEETARRCRNVEIFFLDHYYDLFTYIHDRKERTRAFKQELVKQNLSEDSQLYQSKLKAFIFKESANLRNRRTRTNVAHFSIVRQVGQGGYGQVYLARKRNSNQICALKKMSKRLLQKMGEVEHIRTEREVLTQTDTPWLVKLLYAFQDINFVYLAMEFVPGGDMRTLLNNSGVLKEEFARFYVAEMFVAVAELHRLGFIHRDLKPENFLIDAAGHVKLTDFGLSRGALSPERMQSLRIKLERVRDVQFIHRSTKERRDIYKTVRREDMRAYSLVGSPDYMAPEVLQSSNQGGYTMSVDYWSIGCILFECLAGYPPFTAHTTDDVWVNVCHWQEVLERPHYTGVDEEFNLSNEAWDLITHLIANQDLRYSSLSKVQSHPFFSNPDSTFGRPLDFSLLRSPQGVSPPFIPQLTSETDTGYFDNFDSEADMALYKEVRDRAAELEREAGAGGGDVSGVKRDTFLGFTFTNKDAKNLII
ncbi:hypothetical protein SeMB42_g05166 [Synchytrium endobioticum]|uniref:non-specific serine/threonine protein kinase n=1 Tax=Synchytrium endobioticum TaxID=286115 RepID=A0A507CT53_9FUNG|nr:hypothetical protein SeMB42_g05166 [Synchytrium endobioticum]